jgi:hypothetical protein
VLTDLPDSDEHPKEQKKTLAQEIVWMLHSQSRSEQGPLTGKNSSSEASSRTWRPWFQSTTDSDSAGQSFWLLRGWRFRTALIANRHIKEGAVAIDGVKQSDNKFELPESFVL